MTEQLGASPIDRHPRPLHPSFGTRRGSCVHVSLAPDLAIEHHRRATSLSSKNNTGVMLKSAAKRAPEGLLPLALGEVLRIIDYIKCIFCLGTNPDDEYLSEDGDFIDDLEPSDNAKGDVLDEIKPSVDATVQEKEGEMNEEEEDLSSLDKAALLERLEAISELLSELVQPGARRRPFAEPSTSVNEPGKVREGSGDYPAGAVISGEREKPFREREDYEYVSAGLGGNMYRYCGRAPVDTVQETKEAVPELLESVADEEPGWYLTSLSFSQILAPDYTSYKAKCLIEGHVTEEDYFTEEEAHAALMREHEVVPMCKERYEAVKEILKGSYAVAWYQAAPDEEALKLHCFDSERDYMMRAKLANRLFGDDC